MSKASEDWAKYKYGRVLDRMDPEEFKKRTHPAWPYLYFNPGQPVDPERVDNILKGVIDTHVHGAPLGGWLPGRPTMVETCIEASEAGMKALVFKDHNTMVNNCAIIVQDFLERMKKDKAAQGIEFTPVEVYGGIVLNYTVGGMNVEAVKAALGYGKCKGVWLPSLSAKHQRSAMGLPGGISVSDSAGTLTPEMIAILDVMADYNNNAKGDQTVLSGCHVSNEEKFDILRYIKKRGMNVKVMMDHVTQEMTILTPDEAKEMIDLGGYLQFAECSCVPWPGMQDWIIAFDYSFNLIKELIKEKGPDNLCLITDAGQPGNKPVPGWKMFIKTLLAQGVSEENINIMAKDVPARLIYGE
ncbi:MAG: DUF6282 family protein [Desulfobacterales bacterium]|nr:DUF6282 family protein [Desulfobacterales bacterium]MDD4070918.1 DUF6282 family protein [Desulfobacterales bacterium]MDD4393240.1 DUF6282 family protein [Desulfobacterales bacterium]